MKESKSNIDIKKFLICSGYNKNKDTYKEIDKNKFVILSSKTNSNDDKKQIQYHIIVTNNYEQYYSIYQTNSLNKANSYFNYFVPILNPIIKCKFNMQTLIRILQKITKSSRWIKENNWTICHVYANFNLHEIFDLIKYNKTNDDILIKCQNDLMINLNMQTKSKKFTPLHLAIKIKSFKFAEKFILFGQESIDFRLIDFKGNNIFHFAILAEIKSKNFLKLFLQFCNKDHLIDALRSKNCRQCSVLHLACYSRNTECLKLLLRTPLPIECFVITNELLLKDQSLDDHYKKLESNFQISKSSSSPFSSLSTTNSESKNTPIDLIKHLKTDTLSSTNKPLDSNLISFNKYQINNFLEDDEIYKGGTPLHWCSDKKFIGELLQIGFIKYINVRNINQETALHIAIKRNNFRFIVILFCTGEKIDQTGDAVGNTPLHTAVNYGNLNVVKLLTVFGEDETINCKNNLGLTPRHLAAQNPSKVHTQILYALHILGAKRCEEDDNSENSNKTIHCNIGCSKTGDYNGLSIYDFEVNDNECWYQNLILKKIFQSFQHRNKECQLKKKKSNFDLSTSKKILKSWLSLIRFKSKDKTTARDKLKQLEESINKYDSKTDDNESNKNKNRILSIDGGGVKGLIAIQVLIELGLIELEKRLKYPLSNYFNWFAGTSTGSFIATLISLNYKLTDIRTLYFVIKNKVFQNYLPHDEEILESYLKKYLGERKMDSIINCKLTITSTLYDRLPVQLHLFRNYPSPNELLNKPLPKARLDNKDRTYKEIPNYKEQVIWKACRASSSAPIYFNSFGSFCDGGLISNSPCIDVITEHFIYNELYEELNDKVNSNQELDFIVSVGCGQNNISLNEYEYDFSSFSRVDRFLKYMINAKPFSLILISELNNTEHHKQLRTMAWCKSMNLPYIRLSPFLDGKIKLDERKDEILIDGLWKCKAYYTQKKDIMENLVNLLELSLDSNPTEIKRPKVELNYKIDFDDTKKAIPKDTIKKEEKELNEELIDEAKKQSLTDDLFLNNM